MARPFLIVDGYNVMHAAGLASLMSAERGLEKARHALLHFIADRLTPAERVKARVVFDAMNAPAGLPRTHTVRGISVEFAEPGRDADSVIEDLIRSHSAPGQVRVVSSDHRIQKAARRRRCRFVDSEQWLERLVRRGRRRPREVTTPEEQLKYGGRMTLEELRRWVAEFDGVADGIDIDPGPIDGIEPLK